MRLVRNRARLAQMHPCPTAEQLRSACSRQCVCERLHSSDALLERYKLYNRAADTCCAPRFTTQAVYERRQVDAKRAFGRQKCTWQQHTAYGTA